MTTQQYLELERAAELRHEYYDGQMSEKPRGTFRHALIMNNFGAELANRLKNSPWIVTLMGLRVHPSARCFAYPDVLVTPTESRFLDSRKDTVLNPILLVEILSPVTEAYDRGFKSRQYRGIDSLQEYAVVAQSEPRVEILRRQSNGDWLLSESIGLEAVCRFESVGCSIPLSEIYENVLFDPEEPSPA